MQEPVCMDCKRVVKFKDAADKEGFYYTGRCLKCRKKEDRDETRKDS
jgi:hypothetical protein